MAPMMASALNSETLHQEQHMQSAIDQIQAAAAQKGVYSNVTDDLSNRIGEDQPDANSPLRDPTPGTPHLNPTSHILNTTPPDTKDDIPLDPALTTASQPATSLVSPPASAHAEASHTPPPPSRSASQDPAHEPKPHEAEEEGYTPASAPPLRRESSSSAPEASENGRASSGPAMTTITTATTITGKETSPVTSISTTGEDEEDAKTVMMAVDGRGNNTGEKRKARGASLDAAVVPDEESLKLIKELQAEEYGLRRRERV